MAMLADTVGAILARHENPAFALPFRLLAEIKQPEGYEGVTDYLPFCDALTEVSGDLFLLTALRSGRVKVSSTEWTSSRKSQHFSPSRSEEHTSELQSLMRISYAVVCLKKKQHT